MTHVLLHPINELREGFLNRFVPNLMPESTAATDNSSYLSMVSDRAPAAQTRKSGNRKDMPHSSTQIRADLELVSRTNRDATFPNLDTEQPNGTSQLCHCYYNTAKLIRAPESGYVAEKCTEFNTTSTEKQMYEA